MGSNPLTKQELIELLEKSSLINQKTWAYEKEAKQQIIKILESLIPRPFCTAIEPDACMDLTCQVHTKT